MAISEELQRRIGNLTGTMSPGAGTADAGRMSDQDMNIMMANQAARQGISGPEQRAAMIKKTAMDMGLNMTDAVANAFGVGSMSFEEAMDRARGSNMDFMMAKPLGKAISNQEMEIFGATNPELSSEQRLKNLSLDSTMKMIGDTKGAISNKEMEMFERASPSVGEFTEEDKESLDRLQQRESAIANAPFGELAQELRLQGQEEDTELAHLRLGEVVLPPEFLEDEKFGEIVERKFEESGIPPEAAVVGGIGSLNPNTGLQQFFLKKLAKGLKKVVKKVAPIAQFIPGPIGAAASIYNKGRTILNVAKGKANPLELATVFGPMRTGQSLGDSFKTLTGAKGGISGLFDQVRSGATSFFTDPMSTVSGLFKSQNPADYVEDASGNFANKITGEVLTPEQFKNLATRSGSGIQALTRGVQGGLFGTEGIAGGITQGTGMGSTTYKDAAGNVYSKEQMVAAGLVNPSTGQVIQSVANQFTPSGSQQNTQQAAGGSGIVNALTGGGGGLGDFAKVAGIGALAAGLGKLAYEDTKKQKGVGLTPMVTMSPTGRYNIEAEIARRMGQQRPNPVEFGLLPEGTLPVLSGGQPRQAALGGAIEDLQGGMARGLRYGGGIMAFAQGGAVAMQEGGEMDPGSFPRMDGDINGPGTEQSDDIPAMLSDGEFVMTARAVRGAGSYEMQTEPGGIINLVPSLKEDRERGMDVMYKVMDTFSGQANPS